MKNLTRRVREHEQMENMHLIEECFEDGLSDEEIAQALDFDPRRVRDLRIQIRGEG